MTTTTERTETAETIQTAIIATREASHERTESRKVRRAQAIVEGLPRLATLPLMAIGANGSLAERISRAVAAKYHIEYGTLFDYVTDDIAVYFGRHPGKVATYRNEPKRAVGLWRNACHRRAWRMATGGGSRPTLTVDPDTVDEIASRVAVVSNGTVRGMTDSESATWIRTRGYERAESELFSPWLRATGDSAPAVGSPHPFGQSASDVPERESAGLRRQDLAAVLESSYACCPIVRMFGEATVAASIAAYDATETTESGSVRIRWAPVLAAYRANGGQGSLRTVKRHVSACVQYASTLGTVADRPVSDTGEPWAANRTPSYPYRVPAIWVRGSGESYLASLFGIPEYQTEPDSQCAEHSAEHGCPHGCPTRIARRIRIERTYTR